MVQTLNLAAVTDELVAELGARRAERRQLEQAYKALARAILSDEDSAEVSAA
jgi:hypothetical protein